ncbi:MAG: hypothetical protein C4289_16670 [Chloroflexota bacterium]
MNRSHEPALLFVEGFRRLQSAGRAEVWKSFAGTGVLGSAGMPVDQDTFREAMSHWASGVAIVTTFVDGVPHGMTASAFCSVSTEPPTVLVCVSKQARTHNRILRAGRFGVNILASTQQAYATHFAGTPVFEDGAPLVCEDGLSPAIEGHPEYVTDPLWSGRTWQIVSPGQQAQYLVAASQEAYRNWPRIGLLFVFTLDDSTVPWSPPEADALLPPAHRRPDPASGLPRPPVDAQPPLR